MFTDFCTGFRAGEHFTGLHLRKIVTRFGPFLYNFLNWYSVTGSWSAASKQNKSNPWRIAYVHKCVPRIWRFVYLIGFCVNWKLCDTHKSKLYANMTIMEWTMYTAAFFMESSCAAVINFAIVNANFRSAKINYSKQIRQRDGNGGWRTCLNVMYPCDDAFTRNGTIWKEETMNRIFVTLRVNLVRYLARRHLIM